MNLLTSPCAVATVSSGDGQKTFYLHEALLCYESERFVKQLTSGFSESATRTISECEEDPDLFACFVEYFYRDAWVNNHDIVHDSDYVMLAQLYSLGERLGADRFQEPELPECASEDPVRELVCWYAAARLSTLRDYPTFRHMLVDVPDMGRFLCLRAGNCTSSRPNNGIGTPSLRFKTEEDLELPTEQEETSGGASGW
ncbi:hypothetical protein B0J12DRAFT_739217 [Macrophomina phaseolina]|uniref:BTB domain-containing protein n=1 Tax=Macrophomina phaseolina TaxID=35725 RepID=A0ABQ8GE32_9PEZI|nr:hypothetical protein B0J12DRAFT_739217 [Macrophomina phaseolina]